MDPSAPGRPAQHLDRLYATRFPAPTLELRRRLWRTLIRETLSRYVPMEGTALDLGAGYCDFINQVDAHRRIAVDMNPDTRRHAELGVEVHIGALENLSEFVDVESVDFALASNVFEHLRDPDTLLHILASVREALRPGGALVVIQPNVRLVGTAFWDFVDHTLPLTEKGMAEALTLSGLEIVESRARFLPYTTRTRLPKSPTLLRLYLRLRPAQWLWGKQMFFVARRPVR